VAQEKIRAALASVLADMGADAVDVRLERPRDPSHGDLATNVAMSVAKQLRRAPRQIAEELASRLDLSAAGVESVEVAGPGFLNFRLSPGAVASVLDAILQADREFGKSDVGRRRRVMVEFVSANPTGPLHLGHGRQAALGDAIASLLQWTGWEVTASITTTTRADRWSCSPSACVRATDSASATTSLSRSTAIAATMWARSRRRWPRRWATDS
jgi:arginyl-tRNA synthetase